MGSTEQTTARQIENNDGHWDRATIRNPETGELETVDTWVDYNDDAEEAY